MFQRTKICSGLLIAFGGSALMFAPGAFAQDSSVQRVEITGSSIKRIDAETSVPVTVIKADDLKKQGLTSVEQIMSTISAVQTQQTTSQVVGSGTAGASFANARGLGQNKTLVLLNGRRLANNAIDGSAPDLNMIPFAALERIEVLRDGASSLYGTDAIGGVINFITRSNYRGGTITLGFDSPQHGGGATHSANIGVGMGDLNKDGLNVFGFVDFQKQAAVGGLQRPFNKRIIGGLSPTPFPANYTQRGNPGTPDTYNPAAPDCNLPHLTPDPTGATTDCYETTVDFVNYIPKDTRISGFLKGTFKLGENHTGALEGFVSNNVEHAFIAPVPYGGLYMNYTLPDGSVNPYYPDNPLLSHTFVGSVTTDPNSGLAVRPGAINVKWRDLGNGSREDIGHNNQARFVGSLEGTLFNWDYNTAASYNVNSIHDYLAGYSNGAIIGAGVLNGVIDPFNETQSAAGNALIASAGDSGNLFNAKGEVYVWDGHISREIGDWFGNGKQAQVALGAEARHETFQEIGNFDFATQVAASTGFDPNTHNVGSRRVYAGYFELNLPLLKTLDLTLAGRYDKYSDFGNTFNPKASLLFKPVQQVLLRGSYSTGFRAPSLFELHNAPTFTNTANPEDNPITCPNGEVVAPHQTGTNCSQQFQVLNGGTTGLRPEKSHNATIGIVLEPIKDADISLDFWNIQLRQQIGVFQAPDVFNPNNLGIFGAGGTTPIIHSNDIGELSTDGSECLPGYPNQPAGCGYVDLRNRNLGNLTTNGLDLGANYRLSAGSLGRFAFGLQSTWTHKFAFQTLAGGQYYNNVGQFIPQSNQVVFRWQHNATVTWNQGPFSVGLAGHYKSGYSDLYTNDDGSVHKVSAYATFDTFANWSQEKGFGVTVGIRNMFDRDPPFSNQDTTFQAGYDPRYTDPTGRTFYVRGNYSF